MCWFKNKIEVHGVPVLLAIDHIFIVRDERITEWERTSETQQTNMRKVSGPNRLVVQKAIYTIHMQYTSTEPMRFGQFKSSDREWTTKLTTSCGVCLCVYELSALNRAEVQSPFYTHTHTIMNTNWFCLLIYSLLLVDSLVRSHSFALVIGFVVAIKQIPKSFCFSWHAAAGIAHYSQLSVGIIV